MPSVSDMAADLRRGGYLDAARYLECHSALDRSAEYGFIETFVAENEFSSEFLKMQLLTLWTAYCLHHDLEPDTSIYDEDVCHLWSKLVSTHDETGWFSFRVFDDFMCTYLV